jgi:hypothetical protein
MDEGEDFLFVESPRAAAPILDVGIVLERARELVTTYSATTIKVDVGFLLSKLASELGSGVHALRSRVAEVLTEIKLKSPTRQAPASPEVSMPSKRIAPVVEEVDSEGGKEEDKEDEEDGNEEEEEEEEEADDDDVIIISSDSEESEWSDSAASSKKKTTAHTKAPAPNSKSSAVAAKIQGSARKRPAASSAPSKKATGQRGASEAGEPTAEEDMTQGTTVSTPKEKGVKGQLPSTLPLMLPKKFRSSSTVLVQLNDPKFDISGA